MEEILFLNNLLIFSLENLSFYVSNIFKYKIYNLVVLMSRQLFSF